MIAVRRWVLGVCVGLGILPSAMAATLNDTGQIECFNATASEGTVSSGMPRPEPTGFEDQDCVYGASAADAVGKQLERLRAA